MRTRTRERQWELSVKDIEERPLITTGETRVVFHTSNGRMDGIYHPVEGATFGVVLLSGAGGGFNGPASVYEDLARELADHKIASIRLDYRFPNNLDESVIDAIIAFRYLQDNGVESLGIVGWSFGGAVAITAGGIQEGVKAIATVATQSYGTEAARYFGDKAILLLHGKEDKTLPISCSQHVYEIAEGPKEIKLYHGANHGLDQVRDEMLKELTGFFRKYLQS